MSIHSQSQFLFFNLPPELRIEVCKELNGDPSFTTSKAKKFLLVCKQINAEAYYIFSDPPDPTNPPLLVLKENLPRRVMKSYFEPRLIPGYRPFRDGRRAEARFYAKAF
jgi:hypothetical protein